MTPEECADAVAGPIGAFGTKWMLDPATFAPGVEAGFAGLDFYFCGRGGALGETDGDVVVAAMGVLGPDATRAQWDLGRTVMPVAEAARLFAAACADYGRLHFEADVDYSELASLARVVVEAAHPAGLPLFAAWRNMPRPDDPKGAAAHELNNLREMRGGAHVAAVISYGLAPIEATLVKGGEGTAKFLGHEGPFPDVTDDMRDRWASAEAATTTIVASAFAALDEGERERFAELVSAVLS